MSLKSKTLFLVVFFLLSTGISQGAGSDYFVDGLAPDWNQPSDYPDSFDPYGPAGTGIGGIWRAWCVPTCAAMLIGHWEDVKSRSYLADGSADGNQSNFSMGYQGPSWGLGSEWHDYCADGDSASGPHPLRLRRSVADFGVYMDTNGEGLIGKPNTGTYYMDVDVGMNKFFAAKGMSGGMPAQNLKAWTEGIDPYFGGFSLSNLTNSVKSEIENNRTVIAHFEHWDIYQVSPGGPGNGEETEEEEFEIGDYEFSDEPMGDLYEEEWNYETGDGGLGHSVLVVGYTENIFGAVTHLIVHDNWSGTERNVRIPVGSELVAITLVDGFSLEVDALISGSNALFEVRTGVPYSNVWLAYSIYGQGMTYVPGLGVTLDLAFAKQAGAMLNTDSLGNATWNLPITPAAAGLTVWLQAVQSGVTTNLVSTVVQ